MMQYNTTQHNINRIRQYNTIQYIRIYYKYNNKILYNIKQYNI